MGFIESRTQKLLAAAQARIAPHLEDGETVEVGAITVEGSPYGTAVVVAAVLIVVNVLLIFQGFELRSYTIGLSVGITAAVSIARQSRWIVLTDRRVLFFKIDPLRSRPTRFVESHARHAVLVARDLEDGWGWRRMTYRRPSGSSVVLRFARPWHASFYRLFHGLSDVVALPPPPDPLR